MRERELIHLLAARLRGTHSLLACGIGDDAAVWEWNEKEYGLLSVDTLYEGWDFDRIYHAPRYIGYKAAASAMSDICAMNGQPLFLMVSLGIPQGLSPAYIEDIYEGLRRVEEKYSVAVVGGDISASRDLWLSVAVMGRVEKSKIAYRRGAHPSQLLCVTGDLGGAYAGLKILQREKAVFLQNPTFQPDISGFNYVVSRQLKPEARCDMVARLAELNIIPTSMTDLSDGLAAGLHALAQASGYGFHVYLHRLPFHEQTQRVAELYDMPLTAFMVYGGEEYELLFTVPVFEYDKLRQEPQIHVIGYVREDKQVLLEDPFGNVEPLQELGWDSLRGRDSPQREGVSPSA
ncbi:MAG: thiamine-phosphate kinase [Bacteroidia bacterium]|nr:thiamine-phosphate kinase [Bacteroidia bacterium]MDW8014473.1 thiamine-phosphate kinase [Bacteroidia bacterium]